MTEEQLQKLKDYSYNLAKDIIALTPFSQGSASQRHLICTIYQQGFLAGVQYLEEQNETTEN